MRIIKMFVVEKDGRISYNPALAPALLDRRITALKIDMNDGLDWFDMHGGILKLLLQRKQIISIKTNSDLIAHDDYVQHLKNVSVVFRFRPNCKAQASAKRINAAIDKIKQMNLKGL